MKAYVWITFAFMGWAYYEMSGGAEFEPERPVALAEAETQAPEDLVTRADTTTLLSVSASNFQSDAPATETQITPASLETEQTEAAVAEAVEQAMALQELEDADTPAKPATVSAEPAAQPPADLREVAGQRVNMRQGPGTGFGVIVTLPRGTEVEVLEVDANGWVRLRDTATGQEGWMAERLLTDPA